MRKATILGVTFDAVTPGEALRTLLHFLRQEQNHIVVTPNPEGIMRARRDADFARVLNNADLVLPDGIGVIIASRLLGNPIRGRVTGCDITQTLLGAVKDKACSVYLLGAAPGVALTAKEKLENRYPGLTVAGTHDGYFDEKEEKLILNELRTLKPDILIIGMGMPRQEIWAAAHRDELPVKITLCLGGSIDIFAGTVKRAPKLLQRLGLEWLYRLAANPSRAGRMLALPQFMIAVLKERFKKQ